MQDPFVSYSYLEIGFLLRDGSGTHFTFDLGSALADKKDLGCVYAKGLSAY